MFLIFFFLGGLVGVFTLDLAFALILSIVDSDASSATPRIVAFGIVSDPLLKFANNTRAVS